MFATKPGLFSIGTIVVPTSVWSNQHVKLITSAGLNFVEQVNKHVEHVSKPHVSSDVPIKSILVQPIKIVIYPLLFSNNIYKRCFSNLK
jgi:hypothetical protein